MGLFNLNIKYWVLLFYCYFIPYNLNSSTVSQNYKVQKGDTLFSIARKYNLSLEELLQRNPEKIHDKTLRIGEILNLSPKNHAGLKKNHPQPNKKFFHPLNKKIKIQVYYSNLSYSPHKGLLFASTGNPESIQSISYGVVSCIDYMEGYGNYIILKHSDGYYSIYGNLETINVNEGEKVPAGKKIGSTGPNKGLYFQLNFKDKTLDPELYINKI